MCPKIRKTLLFWGGGSEISCRKGADSQRGMPSLYIFNTLKITMKLKRIRSVGVEHPPPIQLKKKDERTTMMTVSIPTSITQAWNASVHTAAFNPPYHQITCTYTGRCKKHSEIVIVKNTKFQ